MEKDNEFDLALHLMRNATDYYVNHLIYGDLARLNYFTREREKFEALCKSKGSRVEWFSPHGWGSIGCRIVPEKEGAPCGEFCVQSEHCLALSPHS